MDVTKQQEQIADKAQRLVERQRQQDLAELKTHRSEIGWAMDVVVQASARLVIARKRSTLVDMDLQRAINSLETDLDRE